MSLSKEFDKIARERLGSDKKGPRDHFYPSSLGGCQRRAILERAGIEANPPDDKTARTFLLGHVIHDAVQSAIGRTLVGQVWHEVPLRDEEHRISGRLDTLRLMPDGEWVIYEYKSVKGAAFTRNLPTDQHKVQVKLYLSFRPKPDKTMAHAELHKYVDKNGLLPQPKRAHLIYISKEDGQVAEFIIEQDEQYATEIRHYLKDLDAQFLKYLLTGELPAPLGKVPLKDRKTGKAIQYSRNGSWGKAGDIKMIEDWRVSYCPYRGTGKCCGDNTLVDKKENVATES